MASGRAPSEHEDTQAKDSSAVGIEDVIGRAAATADEMTADAPSFLERVPSSWLHHFIICLNFQSLAALFASSRCLAGHVLDAAPRVTLILTGQQRLTAEQTAARRRIITQLLSGRQQGFAAKLRPATWQPFPTELADRVISLSVRDGDSTVARCCQWHAMECLQSVSFEGYWVHQETICELYAAVEAGHLQQLRCLKAQQCDTLPDLDRLVRALGPQLEEVASACEGIITKLSQLTVLQSLAIQGVLITADRMQQLCEHPTLKHLTFTVCYVDQDYSQRSCKWVSVTCESASKEFFVALPLASVPRICLKHSLLTRVPSASLQCADRLGMLASKIVCKPADDSANKMFYLGHACEAMAALVKCMQGVEVLVLVGRLSSPNVVPLIWQGLPLSVYSVYFDIVEGVNWGQLWQGIPQHVTAIQFTSWCGSINDLCTLVRTAPLHVCLMRLVPTSQRSRDALTDACLPALAPSHLEVTIEAVGR